MTAKRKLLLETTTPDGLREEMEIGPDEESRAVMMKLGWTFHGVVAVDRRAETEAPPNTEPIPAFGPPVGTIGHFNANYPAMEQRVEINEPSEWCCESHRDGNRCGREPTRDFMLSGWPYSIALCQRCMCVDLGAPRTTTENTANSIPWGSPFLCEHANECPVVCPCATGCYCKSNTCRDREAATNAENAAPTEPPPAAKKASDRIAELAEKKWDEIKPQPTNSFEEELRIDELRERVYLRAVVAYLDERDL